MNPAPSFIPSFENNPWIIAVAHQSGSYKQRMGFIEEMRGSNYLSDKYE